MSEPHKERLDSSRQAKAESRRVGARLCLIVVLVTTPLWGVAGSVIADDAVAAAESQAEAAAATPEGKKYADEVGTAFGRDQGKSIQACATEVKRPDLSDFRVFVRVGAAGQVEEALVKPSTNLAACLQSKLRAWKVGAPPHADQWVSVDVKLQRK